MATLGPRGPLRAAIPAGCSEEGVATLELQRALRKTLHPVNSAAGPGLQPGDAYEIFQQLQFLPWGREVEGAPEWHILFHVGVVFPGEGCSFGRILQPLVLGKLQMGSDGPRWRCWWGRRQVAPICRHLQVRAQPSCSLQRLSAGGWWGTAGWWGQDQICNLSVLLSCSEGAPCAEGGGSTGWGTPWEGHRVTGTWVKSPLLASRKTGRASWEATGCARAQEQQGTGLLGTEGCLGGVGMGGDPGTELRHQG